MKTINNVLVTGATGYVGGRLVPRLLEAGYRVRILARDPDRLQGRQWPKMVEIIQGDVLKPETLPAAMQGMQAAYYLIHSMTSSDDFHQRDLRAAGNFGRAARDAGLSRIIYLGGLGDPQTDLSEHLRSRQETGQALSEWGVPVTEFRSAIIVGSGSVSFEMIRYLAERLPVMICPQWVFTRVQPIAIRDMLAYLVEALSVSESAGQIIEVGSPDVLTYGEMMLQYAQERGLKRYLIPVPVLTPRLSSHWVHWMTPIPATIARPLIDGLRNEVIVRDDKAKRIFPEIKPIGYRTAVSLALDRLNAGDVTTRWSDALYTSQGDTPAWSLTTQEGMIIELRQRKVEAPPELVYRAFSRLGGEQGWLYFNWAWRLRGILDRLVGGVGFRRGRRDPDELRVGDALDFWRVESVNPGRMILLRAEMKLPGRAWLQFYSHALENGNTLLVQKAFFAPKGLFGFLYWYALYPIHALIFSGLIHKLGEKAEGQRASQEMAGAELSDG